jgi:hypothetical protein
MIKMITTPYTKCRCWRCVEAEKQEQLEAVKRAIAQFEPKKEKRK